MNNVILIGNLTKDIELGYTPAETAYTRFTVAVHSQKEEADFINCIAWRTTAELMSKYCKKGDKIAVNGRIQTRNYENKDGKKVYVVEVVAENVEFLTPRKGEVNPLKSLTEEDEQALPF